MQRGAPSCRHYRCEEGAQTAVYLASSPDVADASGGYYIQSKPAPIAKRAADKPAAQRLWTWSEQQVGR